AAIHREVVEVMGVHRLQADERLARAWNAGHQNEMARLGPCGLVDDVANCLDGRLCRSAGAMDAPEFATLQQLTRRLHERGHRPVRAFVEEINTVDCRKVEV